MSRTTENFVHLTYARLKMEHNWERNKLICLSTATAIVTGYYVGGGGWGAHICRSTHVYYIRV